jgi:hypothetical protein
MMRSGHRTGDDFSSLAVLAFLEEVLLVSRQGASW